jgi:hypothetical protein
MEYLISGELLSNLPYNHYPAILNFLAATIHRMILREKGKNFFNHFWTKEEDSVVKIENCVVL